MKNVSRLLTLAILFSIMAPELPAQTLTTLHAFSGSYDATNSNGINPRAGLILSGSTFYGTAQYGGSAGFGTVFAVNTNGTGFTTLYTFTNGSDGANPQAALILSGSTLYGTTVNGGSAGCGAVFAVNTNGAGFTTLYSFTTNTYDDDTGIYTNSDGANPQAALILAGSTLYGTTPNGGNAGYGAIFAVNTDGTGFATLHSFTAIAYDDDTGYNTNGDGANPQAALILSGNNLFGTAPKGGTGSYGTVFQVGTNGTGFTTLYNFTQSTDGGTPLAGLILSGTNLFGTTEYGGTGSSGTVFRLSTNGLAFKTLYNFTDGNDGAFPYANLILSGTNLFGTAYEGGSANDGTIFRVSTNGIGFKALYTFTGGTNGLNPMASLILSGTNLFGTMPTGGSNNYGTVFQISTNGLGFTNVFSFAGGNDGGAPWAGLVLSGGTLYGTTANGGSWNSGTVFAVNTNGTGYTNLYVFSGGNDGGQPLAALVASGANLYGTTQSGGNSNNGTVFRIGTNGAGFTTLHSFTNGSDGAYPLAGLILSGTNLFGTASSGGTGGVGTVFRVSTNGAGFKTLHGFTGNDGEDPYADLLLIGTNLYGTASAGGANDSGTIFKVSTNGTGFTTLYTFTATTGQFSTNSDGADPRAGLTLAGNILYGTTSVGGSLGAGTVFGISTNGTGFITVHNFEFPLNNTNSDGSSPVADLILVGTNLYGTAQTYGPEAGGTVFTFNTNGTGFANFYSFNGYNNTPAEPLAGLTFADGILYGTGTGGGINGNGSVFSLTLTSAPAPGITSALLDNGIYGNPFTYAITASNSPISFGASGLPAGLSVASGTGVIAGTPAQSGNFTVTLGATNANGFGTAVLALQIATVNLTVTGLTANNKVYDGTTAATLNLTGATLNSVVNGDSLSLDASAASATFAGSDVGNNLTVTISGLALSGVEATNYTLTQPTAMASITPAPAIVTLNRSVQLYDGTAKSVAATTTPPSLPVSLTYNGSATLPSSIGAYTVIGTVTNPDYVGSATNNLYVAGAPQIINVYTNTVGNIIFTWSALPMVNYQVWSTPSLFPVSWTDFNSPVTATNTMMTTQDEINPTNTARFYRVQLLLE